METQDARRLTGGNLLMNRPGPTIELTFDSIEKRETFLPYLKAEAQIGWERMGWSWSEEPGQETWHCRKHALGCTIALPAPLDVLYAAVALLECAVAFAEKACADIPFSRETEFARLEQERDAESNKALLAIQDTANTRGVPFLWDDDEVSVGHGKFSRVWPFRELPAPADIPWSDLKSIPLVLVTGTNGKTTTTRLLARIVSEAGYCVGNTTTDGIFLNGEISDAGDWTGPGGGRAILRHQKVDFAVLETARGGLLRRGLPVERCDVAVVTNVDADHLGEYGILDIEAMAETKTLIGNAVHSTGRVILNGEDEHLMRHCERFSAPVLLFAASAKNENLERHLHQGGEAIFCHNKVMTFATDPDPATWKAIAPIREIPITFDGAARHNVQNAMAAAAAALSIGIPIQAIRDGLKRFSSSSEENPGRANFFHKDGISLVLDFAHNPLGARVTMDFISSLRQQSNHPDGRIAVVTGQAGDRSDDDIRSFAQAIYDGGATKTLIRQMIGYERGRAPGEVERIFQGAFLNCGMAKEQISIVEDEISALEAAVVSSHPGDFILIFTHIQRDEVQAWLQNHGWVSSENR
jgi:cyanophycin synthetase